MESDDLDEILYPAVGLAVAAFVTHKRRRALKTLAEWAIVLDLLEEEERGDRDLEGDSDGPVAKRTRHVFPRKEYEKSPWAIMLQSEELLTHTTKEARLFRRRFRVPYTFFVKIVKVVKDRKWLKCAKKDVAGRGCIPTELKVLSALQILGRGSFFDDVCQLSFMSESTVCAEFHAFCKCFAEGLYDEHIHLPTGPDKAKAMSEYDKLGFTGAIGSTDVTHVKWDCCRYSLQRSYSGKEGYPTIAYQATVSHDGRVLAVTEGFPGAQNDKTIIRYDLAVQRIRRDKEYTEHKFHLYCEDGTRIEVKGNWLLVDNGYHKWRILINPSKYPVTVADTRFSKGLESVRKDVECFFGILKGRFRILKLPMVYRTKERIDNVFFTCCILHNMLHAFDGLDALEAGVHWGGADGNHDPWVADPLTDTGSVGLTGGEEKVEVESAHNVLRKQLLASYTYRKNRNDIVWLQRPT